MEDTHLLRWLQNTVQHSRSGVNRINGVQARERLALIGEGEIEEGFKHRPAPPLKGPMQVAREVRRGEERFPGQSSV